MADLDPDSPDERVKKVLQKAELDFVLDGVSRSVTATNLNRFYVQLDGNFANLVLGGIGVLHVNNEQTGEKEIRPLSQAAGIYRVDHAFLRNLAKVIDELLPGEPPQTNG